MQKLLWMRREITPLRLNLARIQGLNETGLKRMQDIPIPCSSGRGIPIAISRRMNLFGGTHRYLRPAGSFCMSDKSQTVQNRKFSGFNMNTIETPQQQKKSPRWPWILAGITGLGALYTANALQSDEIYRRAVIDVERGDQTVSLNTLQVAAPTLPKKLPLVRF